MRIKGNVLEPILEVSIKDVDEGFGMPELK